MAGHCLLAMKIMHLYANGCFDWLISGQQSVNPSREAISIASGKYRKKVYVCTSCDTMYSVCLLCIASRQWTIIIITNCESKLM